MDSSEIDKQATSLSRCRHNSRTIKLPVKVQTYLAMKSAIYCNVNNTVFLKGRFLLENQQNYTTYKICTYMYIPPPATYANTIHNTK